MKRCFSQRVQNIQTAPDRQQGGAGLTACALLLLMVLLLNIASLRASRNQQNAALVQADRSIARNAAEAALLDAEQHLMIIDDPLSPVVSGITYLFGSVTGLSYPESGSLQSARPPSYRIDLIAIDATGGICRVSATGTGLLATTEVRLQADYAVSSCGIGTGAGAGADAESACTREVRRLAWREQATD